MGLTVVSSQVYFTRFIVSLVGIKKKIRKKEGKKGRLNLKKKIKEKAPPAGFKLAKQAEGELDSLFFLPEGHS